MTDFRLILQSLIFILVLNSTGCNDFFSLPNQTPTGLSLITPETAVGFSDTPTIRVHGVRRGQVVKLFSDNNCATLVSSGTAIDSTINLTTSSLPAGAYTFYAKTFSPNPSACSSANISYEFLECPTGYIEVNGDESFDTNPFCVMQFEAKQVGGDAKSQALTTPWVSINQVAAKSACTSLGTGYDLISNSEWMTIAHDVESNTDNWDSGQMYKGNTDAIPDSILEVTDINDPYNGTVNSSIDPMGTGKEQKRTYTLNNGQVIWDLSGNVWELVDWTKGGVLDIGPTTCSAVVTEFPDVNCAELAAIDFMPANPNSEPIATYNSTYGIGKFIGGLGGSAIRGGRKNYNSTAGVFTLYLNFDLDDTSATVGFRCVYRGTGQ